jgi:hypothetical protein
MNDASYANYANFMGASEGSDPLTMCMVDTMDKSFLGGGIASRYGPRSRSCQAFMSERCAKNWDGFCEYTYQTSRINSNWPNNQLWPNTFQTRLWDPTYGMSTGQQLLKNAAERKYCTYLNCVEKKEKFNPLDPNGPNITYYENPTGENVCVPVCRVDPTTIDNDPLMDKLFADRKAGNDVLINICNTARREGVNLAGTKIGTVCDQYFGNLNSINNSIANSMGQQQYDVSSSSCASSKQLQQSSYM